MLTAGSVDAWLACALRRRQIAGRFSLLFGTRGPMLDSEQMFRRYQDLQAYVRWSDDDVVVDTARNGRSALELIRRRPYDVALLDLKMPGMDGRTL